MTNGNIQLAGPRKGWQSVHPGLGARTYPRRMNILASSPQTIRLDKGGITIDAPEPRMISDLEVPLSPETAKHILDSEQELRAQAAQEQRDGIFSRELSLAIDLLDNDRERLVELAKESLSWKS